MQKKKLPLWALSWIPAGVLGIVCAVGWAFTPARGTQTDAPVKSYRVNYSSNPATSQEIPAGAAPTTASSPASGAAGPAPSPTPAPERFLVRSVPEGVALFREGDPLPLRTLKLDTSALPPADRRLLEEGIPAATLARAREILEDYE